RSFLLTVIVFSAGVVSAAASLGTVWITGQTIDAILMSMPSLVYVLSISGAVHLINYYRDAIREGGLHGAVERAVVHAWKPAALSSITTALGLISLYASELVPIQKFGLYSAIAMITLVCILFLFLPAALHVFHIGRRWVEPAHIRAARLRHDVQPPLETLTKAERFWRWFASKLVNNHALVMTTCLLVIGVIGWGITRNRTSINLLELFDSKARILRDYAWLEDNLGVLVPMEIVLKFDPNSVLGSDASHHQSSEDLYRLSFLERMETIARVQAVITDKFGAEGQGIVGSCMSAVSFAPTLPSASGNTVSFMHRKALNMRLESSRQGFMDAGFLQIDPDDGCELWRISLRVAAFKGVDYGQLVTEIKDAVQPVVQAHVDRNRVLRQIAAWSPGNSYGGARIMVWDRTGQNKDIASPNAEPASASDKPSANNAASNDVARGAESATDNTATINTVKPILAQNHVDQTAMGTAPHVETLSSLLVNARCRVFSTDVDPTSITLTNLERLNATDAVVLVGNFSDSDMRTISGSLPHTIVAGEHGGSRVRRSLGGDSGIGNREPELHAVYTGVVPIVYKAQRALLDSLIQSTLWSFLTITPLMMIVSRSLTAGAVAMIPNVLPVLVIFGAMGWMGIAIDIGSMMTASIALGVAVDDTIHFLSWYRDDLDRMGNRRQAIISCYAKCATPTLQAALISGLGLSVFAFSTFTPTQRFGWLMLSILVAGVVAELLMLPALLAGPLGVVFKAHTKRHSFTGRLYLIVRYQFRRWQSDHRHPESTQQARSRREAA
ncbi:MAG: MMPL family transporter, partial [Pirellulaceae bacterium]|nr:MMPL family transporter [Pirellulaceae bacterium]